jgi:hypothetical protein
VARALAALAATDADIPRVFVRSLTHLLEFRPALDDPGVRAKFDALAPTLPRYPEGTPTREHVLAAMRTAERPAAG